MQKYTVASCALKERDQRLLGMLVSLPAASRFEFLMNKTTFTRQPSIAIVDTGSPLSLSTYEDLLSRFGKIVPVAIVDSATEMTQWPFKVERPSLLRSIFKVLNSIVDADLARRNAAVQAPLPESPRTTLPNRAADERGANDSVFAEGPGSMPEPLRALVVDDSLAVRAQLRAGLNRLGFKCEEAVDAEQAQATLARGTYDLALLDVVMPGMDGYQLCRLIKQDRYRRNMPIVMLTSRSSPFDRARGVLAGCDTYLTKPIAWNDFRTAIDKALLKNSSNSRDKLASRGYAGSL